VPAVAVRYALTEHQGEERDLERLQRCNTRGELR
jgi:hypothetical protein